MNQSEGMWKKKQNYKFWIFISFSNEKLVSHYHLLKLKSDTFDRLSMASLTFSTIDNQKTVIKL